MNNMNTANENQITCDICRDLLPLVNDGVASADSEAAVRQHIQSCGDCALLFDGKFVPAVKPSESPKTLLRVKRWLTGIYTALMMLGIYFGLTLTASEDMFLNCLIMPIAGVFGYLVFHRKALFAMPGILLVIHIIINEVGLVKSGEWLEFVTLLPMTLIYYLFALAGIIIAMLLHFAFGKKSDRNLNGGGNNEN